MTTTSYSIAEARNKFTALIRKVEKQRLPIYLTRRGETVAVIISQEEYEQLLTRPPQKKGYWTAYQAWREKWNVANLELDPDEIWGNVRDHAPVPEVNPWL